MDDKSIKRATENIFASMTSIDRTEKLWMALDTYTKSRLREKSGIRIELTLKYPYDNEKSFMIRKKHSREDLVQRTINDCKKRLPNAWLSKTDLELVEYSKDVFHGNADDIDRSMTVSVVANSASAVSRHLSFGFYIYQISPRLRGPLSSTK